MMNINITFSSLHLINVLCSFQYKMLIRIYAKANNVHNVV